MSGYRMNPLWQLGLGVALVIGGMLQVQLAHAAERIVGQVTKNEPARKKIELDGTAYVVSPKASVKRAGRYALPSTLESIKPGQSAKFEVEKGVVTSITLIEGPVPE